MAQQLIFSIGDNVQIIDHDETTSERATFVIADIKSSRYSLAAKDKHLCEPLWVTSNEITLVSSENNSSKVCPNCQGQGRYQTFMGRDGWTFTTCPLCNPNDPWYKQYNNHKK